MAIQIQFQYQNVDVIEKINEINNEAQIEALEQNLDIFTILDSKEESEQSFIQRLKSISARNQLLQILGITKKEQNKDLWDTLLETAPPKDTKKLAQYNKILAEMDRTIWAEKKLAYENKKMKDTAREEGEVYSYSSEHYEGLVASQTYIEKQEFHFDEIDYTVKAEDNIELLKKTLTEIFTSIKKNRSNKPAKIKIKFDSLNSQQAEELLNEFLKEDSVLVGNVAQLEIENPYSKQHKEYKALSDKILELKNINNKNNVLRQQVRQAPFKKDDPGVISFKSSELNTLSLTTSQTQSQQQQQQEQQMVSIQVKNFEGTEDLIDFSKFFSKENDFFLRLKEEETARSRLHGETENHENLINIERNLKKNFFRVGEKDNRIGVFDYVTEEAAMKISQYIHQFQFGVDWDNLPVGFSRQKIKDEKSEKEKWVLVYQKPKKEELSAHETRFAQSLKMRNQVFFKEGAFGKPLGTMETYETGNTQEIWAYIQENPTENFKKLLKYFYTEETDECKKISEKIGLLELEKDNLYALAQLLVSHHEGFERVKKLISALAALKQSEAGKFCYQTMTQTFMKKTHSSELLEIISRDETIETIEKITKLDKEKKILWTKLYEKHINSCGVDDINQLFRDFEVFLQEMEALGIEITSYYQIIGDMQNLGHMSIGLKQISNILKNIKKPEDRLAQLKELPKLTCRLAEVEYVVSELGFQFVDNSLCLEKALEPEEYDISDRRKLIEKISNLKDMEQAKAYFFRYYASSKRGNERFDSKSFENYQILLSVLFRLSPTESEQANILILFSYIEKKINDEETEEIHLIQQIHDAKLNYILKLLKPFDKNFEVKEIQKLLNFTKIIEGSNAKKTFDELYDIMPEKLIESILKLNTKYEEFLNKLNSLEETIKDIDEDKKKLLPYLIDIMNADFTYEDHRNITIDFYKKILLDKNYSVEKLTWFFKKMEGSNLLELGEIKVENENLKNPRVHTTISFEGIEEILANGAINSEEDFNTEIGKKLQEENESQLRFSAQTEAEKMLDATLISHATLSTNYRFINRQKLKITLINQVIAYYRKEIEEIFNSVYEKKSEAIKITDLKSLVDAFGDLEENTKEDPEKMRKFWYKCYEILPEKFQEVYNWIRNTPFTGEIVTQIDLLLKDETTLKNYLYGIIKLNKTKLSFIEKGKPIIFKDEMFNLLVEKWFIKKKSDKINIEYYKIASEELKNFTENLINLTDKSPKIYKCFIESLHNKLSVGEINFEKLKQITEQLSKLDKKTLESEFSEKFIQGIVSEIIIHKKEESENKENSERIQKLITLSLPIEMREFFLENPQITLDKIQYFSKGYQNLKEIFGEQIIPQIKEINEQIKIVEKSPEQSSEQSSEKNLGFDFKNFSENSNVLLKIKQKFETCGIDQTIQKAFFKKYSHLSDQDFLFQFEQKIRILNLENKSKLSLLIQIFTKPTENCKSSVLEKIVFNTLEEENLQEALNLKEITEQKIIQRFSDPKAFKEAEEKRRKEIASIHQEKRKKAIEKDSRDKVLSQLNSMQDLNKRKVGNPFSIHVKKKLLNQYLYVEAITQREAISGVTEKPLMQLQAEELKKIAEKLEKNIKILNQIDPRTKIQEAEREQALLQYLAVLSEMMYHARGFYPYSTQILSLLSACMNNDNRVLGISTGEGKSLISGIQGAFLRVQGSGSVEVCSSNIELAEEGLKENKKFFELLGIETSVIQGASEGSDFKPEGINYSTIAQLSLFKSKAEMTHDEQALKNMQFKNLVIDEVDFATLDDPTEFRFSMQTGSEQIVYQDLYNSMYEILFDKKYQSAGIVQEENGEIFFNLKRLREKLIDLNQHTPNFQKVISRLEDKELKKLIQSAYSAHSMLNDSDLAKHVSIETEKITTRFGGEKTVRYARPYDAAVGVKKDSEFDGGVQQFLHVGLNQLAKGGKNPPGKGATFPVAPESHYVATEITKTVIDAYHKTGRVIGFTGTPGEYQERMELQEAYGFSYVGMPKHNLDRRENHRPVFTNNAKDHLAAIRKEVLKVTFGKPLNGSTNITHSLLFCETPGEAKALFEQLTDISSKESLVHKAPKMPFRIQLYDGQSGSTQSWIIRGQDSEKFEKQAELEEAEIVALASNRDPKTGKVFEGTDNMPVVTITTQKLTRGTDFKPPDSQAGLQAILCFPASKRDEIQALGRVGRKNDFGIAKRIYNVEKLMFVQKGWLASYFFKHIPNALKRAIARDFQKQVDKNFEAKLKSEKQQRLRQQKVSVIKREVKEKWYIIIQEIHAQKEKFEEKEKKELEENIKKLESELQNLTETERGDPLTPKNIELQKEKNSLQEKIDYFEEATESCLKGLSEFYTEKIDLQWQEILARDIPEIEKEKALINFIVEQWDKSVEPFQKHFNDKLLPKLNLIKGQSFKDLGQLEKSFKLQKEIIQSPASRLLNQKDINIAKVRIQQGLKGDRAKACLEDAKLNSKLLTEINESFLKLSKKRKFKKLSVVLNQFEFKNLEEGKEFEFHKKILAQILQKEFQLASFKNPPKIVTEQIETMKASILEAMLFDIETEPDNKNKQELEKLYQEHFKNIKNNLNKNNAKYLAVLRHEMLTLKIKPTEATQSKEPKQLIEEINQALDIYLQGTGRFFKRKHSKDRIQQVKNIKKELEKANTNTRIITLLMLAKHAAIEDDKRFKARHKSRFCDLLSDFTMLSINTLEHNKENREYTIEYQKAELIFLVKNFNKLISDSNSKLEFYPDNLDKMQDRVLFLEKTKLTKGQRQALKFIKDKIEDIRPFVAIQEKEALDDRLSKKEELAQKRNNLVQYIQLEFSNFFGEQFEFKIIKNILSEVLKKIEESSTNLKQAEQILLKFETDKLSLEEHEKKLLETVRNKLENKIKEKAAEEKKSAEKKSLAEKENTKKEVPKKEKEEVDQTEVVSKKNLASIIFAEFKNTWLTLFSRSPTVDRLPSTRPKDNSPKHF